MREQKLQVGFSVLIYPPYFSILQRFLDGGKVSVGAATASGPYQPHTSICFTDPTEQFGVDAIDVDVTFRLEVGVGAAGVSLRPHPTNEFIDPLKQFGPAQS